MRKLVAFGDGLGLWNVPKVIPIPSARGFDRGGFFFSAAQLTEHPD